MYKKGFTLIELLIVIAIIAILSGVLIVVIKPETYFKRGRDAKRLSNMNALVQAIQEYHLDNGYYPDAADTLRTSNTLAGSSTSLLDARGSWIDADLSKYMSKMYVDPVNNSTYYIRYMHNGIGFEIDITMEAYIEEAANTADGGNNDNKYEIGSDLSILD